MSYAYVGKCPGCGNVVAAALDYDTPGRKKEVANSVAEWIVDGLEIERVDGESVRVTFASCVCPRWEQDELPLSETRLGQ